MSLAPDDVFSSRGNRGLAESRLPRPSGRCSLRHGILKGTTQRSKRSSL